MKSITLLLLLSLSRVFADGACKHVFLAEPARIPRQSAAISFAEGKETLTIRNTVEAKGQDLAWMLPLPSRPEVIRPSHPTASGPSAAHPLSVRFSVEKPVYPMSLTKSAGTVPVEIFRMGKPVRDPSGRLDAKGATSDETFGAFRSLHSEFSALSAARAAHGLVGFESLQEHVIEEDRDLLLDQLLLARGVIRFTARFSPASDWSDFQFEPAGEMPKLARHVTRQWLVDEAMNEVAFKATAAFLLLGLASHWCGKPGRRPHIAWARVGLVMLLGAAG